MWDSNGIFPLKWPGVHTPRTPRDMPAKYIPLIAAPVHVEIELAGATEAQASAELRVL